MKTLAVSVVIPALDEATRLADTLARIGADDGRIEQLVVDGGSRDDTVAIAVRSGARVVHSPARGRATQMNLGAREARAPILLFLHADTHLPGGWLEAIHSRMDSDPSLIGGAFRRRFDSSSRLLRATCRLADLRGQIWGGFLGDQAMFIRTAAFHALGGFGPYERCEDLDLSRRMAALGRTCQLPDTVISSARRFERRGPFIQTLFDFVTATRFLVATRAHAAGHRHSSPHPGTPVMPSTEI